MPADRRKWFHVILTTYGAWLYGDARGFRTRHHREHVEGDYKCPPPPRLYDDKERRSRELLKQPPVVLPPRLRPLVGRALWQELTRLGGWVVVMAVSGQHVHLLVKLPAGRERAWAGRAKRHATLKLREYGWRGMLWGVRSKAEPIRNRAHQENTYKYIMKHAEEGAWIGQWKRETGAEGVSES